MSSYPTSETSASANTNAETAINCVTFAQVIKKLVLFFVIYSIGYFELAPLWIGLLLLVLVLDAEWTKRKKRKLLVARAMALGYEKEIITNRLKPLPSWVKFRDVEKTEWLNDLFKQIWQQFSEYTHDLVPKILEPAIQSYVSDFKFNHVVLGNVPLRVDGVQVYDEGKSRKIVMDLDISYVGDCYVTFQTFRVTGGVKDITFRGRLRVVLTPLVSKLPLIGGVQLYFMQQPHIDFDFFKITSILDIPVIRNRIKNTAMNVLNSMLLYPNFYSINLRQGIKMSKLAVFRTEGVLRVHVVDAVNLENKDLIGKSDPYVVLSLGSIRVETPVVRNCLNPKWDFWREFEIDRNSHLKIQVWDKDDGSKDDFLGRATVDIGQVAKLGHADKTIPLDGVSRGTIRIRLSWLSLSSSYSDLEDAIKEAQLLSPYLHTSLLMIYLDSSSDLPIKTNPPNPYVELEVEDLVKVTDVELATSQPIWDKGFTFLIRDPRQAVLNLRVVDDETKLKLGEVSFPIDNLKDETNTELRRHTFFLNKSGSEARICCSMKLRIFKSEDKDEESKDKVLIKQESDDSSQSVISGETESSPVAETESTNITSDLGKIRLSLYYSQQRQKLVVKIYEAEIFGGSQSLDSYVKLYLQVDKLKNNKQRTKTAKNTNSPVFNTEFEFLISDQDLNFTSLVLQVNSEKSFRKKFLGQAVISLAKCVDLTEAYTNWFRLTSEPDMDVYHLVK